MMNHQTNQPLPGAKIPTGKKIFWGIGGATDTMVMNGINGLVDQVYTIGMSLDPKWVAVGRSVPRFLDLVMDPLIGHWSDNTRSRWGRRKPWMIIGVLVSSVVAVAMWYPPVSLGVVAVNLFVVGMLALLFTVGYSTYTIPYNAMGYEMSTDTDERTHLFKYRLLAYTAAMLVTPWLARWCLEIEGEKSAVLKGVQGIHWVSLGMAAIILVTGLVPILFCKDIVHVPSEKKVPFRDAVRYTFKNKAFLPVILGNFMMRFGMCVSGIFFYYVFVYRIGGSMLAGATAWGWFVTVITVSTLAGTPLVAGLTKRLGKKQMAMTLMILSAFAYASMWWTFTPQAAPMKLYLLTAAGIGLFCNTLPMVINSMLADVCDADELNSGARREAFYGAVFVTCDKLAFAFALLLQGFLLQSSGFNARLEIQAAATVNLWMNWLIATQPTGFVLGMLCICAYPLSRAKVLEIRAQLDARQGPI